MNAAELQFHWMRLGNCTAVAHLYRTNSAKVLAVCPVSDQQRYMRGQMVNIGGILAKRCVVCMTAREAHRFYADEHRASGCRAVCDICREAAGIIPQRDPFAGRRGATAKPPAPNGTERQVRPCSQPS